MNIVRKHSEDLLQMQNVPKLMLAFLRDVAWLWQKAVATLNYLWVFTQRREVWVCIYKKNFQKLF
jgi:hypothetical protein